MGSLDGSLPSRPLRLDPDAPTASAESPAFLAPPADAPVYHGFPLVEASRTPDGWCFGVITDPDCPEGGVWGDAYVVAPDGSRAGIVWQTGLDGLEVIMEPEDGRWGAYGVPVPRPIRTQDELMVELAVWLPVFRQRHAAWAGPQSHPVTTPPASNVEP